MEDTLLPENPGSAEPKGCVNCGSHFVEENYPTRLCSSCRQLFIKFPIPLGIRLFGIGVGLVLFFAMFSFPKNFMLAKHFEKGKLYEAKKQYKSAQREFSEVVLQAPDNLEANEHLAIAAFYNLDLEKFVRAVDKMQGKKVEDEALYNELSDLITRAKGFFPDEELDETLMKYNDKMEVPDSVFTNYLKEKPDNEYALFCYAGILYGRKDFISCDKLLQRLLGVDAEHLLALRMLATIARQRGQLQKSEQYCHKIIDVNKEAGYAYASLARTYLKGNKLTEGLNMAQKSVAIDKEDAYNEATLAIAWHMNKQTAKRDNVIKELKQSKDSTATGDLQFAMDVINQKDSL
jgi:tetratricopeptide (TPR) repeat protein